MKTGLLLLMLLTSVFATAQNTSEALPADKGLPNRIIVKTNVLNLFARGTSVSIEKNLPNNLSVELGFQNGRFRNILLTDLYEYSGFQARLKKYFFRPGTEDINPFAGIYAGNLNRKIFTQAKPDLYIPGRDFAANSIRAGGSLGFSYISSTRFVLECQGSLGYGHYLNFGKSGTDWYSKGYPDVQVVVSLGYCF